MKKLPQIISIEEYEKLLQAALKESKQGRSKKKQNNRKCYALCIMLGFESGMRISEIVGHKDIVPALTKDNVSLAQNTIKIVSGKGQKDRVVPLPKRFNARALEMLPLSNKFQRRALQSYVTNLGQKVLGKHITFHTLRHGFATHFYNRTKDIRGLQVMLGHSRLDTTSIYAAVNPQDTIKAARDVF